MTRRRSSRSQRDGSATWRIKISANGNSVYAKVVDECDSVEGCDEDHNFEPPCDNNIVDASPAVWDALGLDQNVGMVDITWSEE